MKILVIENEIYLGVGTDNTLGRALLAAMSDNQLEQCEYFEYIYPMTKGHGRFVII